jgi:hypothetical protein
MAGQSKIRWTPEMDQRLLLIILTIVKLNMREVVEKWEQVYSMLPSVSIPQMGADRRNSSGWTAHCPRHYRAYRQPEDPDFQRLGRKHPAQL